MAVRYHVFQNPDYLHLYLSGQVTAEDYFGCFAKLADDDAFYPSIATLMEIGHAAKIAVDDIDMEEAERMSAVVGEVRTGASYRIALAGGPPDTRSFVSMAQEIVSGGNAESSTFDSVLEASQWLWRTEETPVL